MPPSVLDVTYAVQCLVSDSQLELFEDVSKSGLMGFCDVAPNQEKMLKMQYLYKNRAYRVEGTPENVLILVEVFVVGEFDGVKLPKQGVMIKDLHEAEDVMEAAKSCGYGSQGASSS